MCVFSCCCCCRCCFDYSGMLRTKYYTHCTMLPIILFCCSFLSSSMSSLLFFLSLFAFAFISLWMRESARLCVRVCVRLQNFSAFILFHIYAQYVYEFAGEKSKTTNRKTSESIRKSCKQYFGICECLRELHLMCNKTYTHTLTPKDLYDKGKRYVNFIKGSRRKNIFFAFRYRIFVCRK